MMNRLFWRLGAALALPVAMLTSAQADLNYTREGPLTPGPDDGNIAAVTARLLEQKHYREMTFDDVVSSNFFHRYLTTLDPQHLHFRQSDIDEFSDFEDTLDDITNERNAGPGFDIFQRFFERMEERTAFAHENLKAREFVFEDTDPILINRREADWPATLAESRSLWLERLRYEFLEEKLALIEERRQAAEKAEGADPEEETKSAPVKSVEEEVREKLERRYSRNLKFFAEWDSDDVIQLYLSTLGHAYDPHTDYMGRAALEQFAINMNLSLFGIGAQLRALDGYCTIERLLAGGPAIKSNKLREKERIVAVAQADGEAVDVVDMSLNKIVQLIRGPKGTVVQLTIIPPEGEPSSERRVVKLTRDEIPLEDQAAKAKLIELPSGDGVTNRIGVIDLPTFYAPMNIVSRRQASETQHSTTEDVALLVEKLKKVGIEGLILDLRRNGGGSLEEAIRLTGLFIKKGPVVQVANPDGSKQIESDRDPSILYDGPLLVLTSRGSASASEIVAGALQDYGRAIVVGDSSTHGKGTVQSLNQLGPFFRVLRTQEDPGALKVTIRKFYRANGESTQLRGITPDIILPSVANILEDVGEAGLDNPLEWDTIESARFDPVNEVQPYLPELRNLSDARVSLSQDFNYIREDMERVKERQDRKTALLNEIDRTKELEEAKARDETRKAERANRPPANHIVYEITLKDVDLPGLPAPIGMTNASRLGASGETAENVELAVDEDAEAEDNVPAVDPTADEAHRILLDYIRSSAKTKVVTAGKKDA